MASQCDVRRAKIIDSAGRNAMTAPVPRWDQVKEIVHQALLLPAEHRRGFLDEACGEAVTAEIFERKYLTLG